MQYTKEEWGKVFELYQKGYGAAHISRITGMHKKTIQHRCRQYDLSGDRYTQRKANVRPNPELKKTVIESVEQQSLSLAEVTVKYGISRHCLQAWLSRFRHGGYEELLATKPRGRPPKVPKPKRTKGMSEVERLKERIAYLEAENAYLKKLKALDQEESAEMFGRPDLKMVMEMLDRAYAAREVKAGLMLHSDQGWQYQHYSYQRSLRDHDIVQSMSRKGNCLDNAMMENFFGIMKSELLYPNTFHDVDHFKQELRKYIKYYNNDRIKLRLKGMSPVQYRTHNAVLS